MRREEVAQLAGIYTDLGEIVWKDALLTALLGYGDTACGGDAEVTALVNDLINASAEFRELWQRHEVGVRRSDLKRTIHPEVGMIELRCEVRLTPYADLNLLAFFPREGTDAAEKPELPRVIGTQDFQTTS